MTREHGLIVIDARAAPRWQVVQQLVAATGSTLHAQPQMLAQARPLNLQWQGRDAMAAWAAVLGQEVNHAMACGTDRCRVWLVQDVPATSGGQPPDSASRSPPLTDPAAAEHQPDPPGLFPAE